jgi:hypothetical protein
VFRVPRDFSDDQEPDALIVLVLSGPVITKVDSCLHVLGPLTNDDDHYRSWCSSLPTGLFQSTKRLNSPTTLCVAFSCGALPST